MLGYGNSEVQHGPLWVISIVKQEQEHRFLQSGSNYKSNCEDYHKLSGWVVCGFSCSFLFLWYQSLNSGCHTSYRQVPYHLSHTPSSFWNRVSHLRPRQPGSPSSYLCFPRSWENRHVPLQPTFSYWLKWDLSNFLSGLA
jgi:hypothetical protein